MPVMPSNDDLRQILPVVFPQFLMACGFLIGPLSFSPSFRHTLVVLDYIASRSQKAAVRSVYSSSIYKPHIFTYTHLVVLSGGFDVRYLQTSFTLPACLFARNTLSVLSLYLAGSVPSF